MGIFTSDGLTGGIGLPHKSCIMNYTQTKIVTVSVMYRTKHIWFIKGLGEQAVAEIQNPNKVNYT